MPHKITRVQYAHIVTRIMCDVVVGIMWALLFKSGIVLHIGSVVCIGWWHYCVGKGWGHIQFCGITMVGTMNCAR